MSSSAHDQPAPEALRRDDPSASPSIVGLSCPRCGGALAEAGVKGHVVEEARRIHLPFWDLQAKVVGWQRYRERVSSPERASTSSTGFPPSVEPPQYVLREESFGRNVNYSTPACDVRGWRAVRAHCSCGPSNWIG